MRRASGSTDNIHSPAVRMKLRGHYEKPSERRVREKAAAIRLARKLARKKLQARICCRDEASGGSGGPRKSRPSAHSSLLIFEHPSRKQSRCGGKGRKRWRKSYAPSTTIPLTVIPNPIRGMAFRKSTVITGGQSAPTPKHIDFKPGELLGSVSGELGLRKFLEGLSTRRRKVILFLLGSRYCETDRLSDEAWRLFGNTPLGWPRVQAICGFVHNHLIFGYEHARATRTAFEAHQERRGVCRDYAHLAVAFCRCLNIPARYCTGYITDIGLPPPYAPVDFY
jgi:hypothetical protein